MFEDEPTIETTKAFATGLYQGAQLRQDELAHSFRRGRVLESTASSIQSGFRLCIQMVRRLQHALHENGSDGFWIQYTSRRSAPRMGEPSASTRLVILSTNQQIRS